MTKLNQESGRSMVEMLGVLAIIGVLSIGGIAGYTMAMNRFRANEILDAASKVSIIAQTLNGGQGDEATLGDAGFPTLPGDTEPLVQGVAISADRNGCVRMTGTVSEGVRDALLSIAGSDSGFSTAGHTGFDVSSRAACTYAS